MHASPECSFSTYINLHKCIKLGTGICLYLYLYFTPSIPQHTTEMLYLVGLGLNNEKDITVGGLEVVRRAERVYLEAYTAVLMVGKEKLVSPLSLEKEKTKRGNKK